MALACLLLSFLFFAMPHAAGAQSITELQAQIDANAAQIEKINAEIALYEKELQSTTAEKNTLQNKVNQLSIQRKQLQASINKTQSQINTTQLQIRQLGGTIEEKELRIDAYRESLSQSIRLLHEAESRPLVLAVLGAASISSAWSDLDALASIQNAVQADIVILRKETDDLNNTKITAEEKRAQLLREQAQLGTQQGSLQVTINAQTELLTETKSQESAYQRILKEKQAAKASFEAALQDLSAQYQQAIDPSKIPAAGKGVLRMPLDNVRITQYFGNTAFAAAGAYNGKGHNGIDFGAPIGTPLKASLSGTVLATGNTDLVRGCYSFGKWVMLKHANGLNTMYAHLSQINVSDGQSVSTGQLIGYSGDTGYATGPHLHFGVYLSSATQIVRLGQATNKTTACSNAEMPVPTSIEGYLNPMNYL
jgi:murein DD-endopeptidase MepM/ murein hydrolase activator NlpD